MPVVRRWRSIFLLLTWFAIFSGCHEKPFRFEKTLIYPHIALSSIFHGFRTPWFWFSFPPARNSSKLKFCVRFSPSHVQLPVGFTILWPSPFHCFWREWTMRGLDSPCFGWSFLRGRFFIIGPVWVCFRGGLLWFRATRWIGWLRWTFLCFCLSRSRKCFISALLSSRSGFSPRLRTYRNGGSAPQLFVLSLSFWLFPSVLGWFDLFCQSRWKAWGASSSVVRTLLAQLIEQSVHRSTWGPAFLENLQILGVAVSWKLQTFFQTTNGLKLSLF